MFGSLVGSGENGTCTSTDERGHRKYLKLVMQRTSLDQAGAQHSQSPMNAEDRAVMI
jgi:hypothetical protein